MLKVKLLPTRLSDVYQVEFDRHKDHRGGLIRAFDKRTVLEEVGEFDCQQISISNTAKKYTVRGLHLSLTPNEETKWLVCLSGVMQWVIVDLREKSPQYGEIETFILSESSPGLFVPRGFAHGCLSLEDNTNMLLMVDNIYDPERGTGIHYRDKRLNVPWKLPAGVEPIIGENDAKYLSLDEFERKFRS